MHPDVHGDPIPGGSPTGAGQNARHGGLKTRPTRNTPSCSESGYLCEMV